MYKFSILSRKIIFDPYLTRLFFEMYRGEGCYDVFGTYVFDHVVASFNDTNEIQHTSNILLNRGTKVNL